MVSTVTHYGLDGPGIESWWGAKLSTPILSGPGAHPASYTTAIGSYLGMERPGHGVYHPPPSRTKVKE
jgi:hypothetical protein